MASPATQSVLKDVKTLMTTPESADVGNVIANAQKLTPAEIEELAREISNLPDLTAEARHSLEIQLSAFLESKPGVEITFQAARNASRLVAELDAKLEQLLKDVASIDANNKTTFGDTVRKLLDIFRAIIGSSRGVANRIATYGKDFHKIIKPAVNDPTVKPEDKVEFIRDFKARTKEFEKDSENISSRLRELNSQFTQFFSEFEAWGKADEDKLTASVKELQERAANIRKEIAELTKKADDAVNAGVGVAICGGFLVFAGPFGVAAAAVIGTLSVAGGAIAAAAYMIAAHEKEKAYEAVKKQLENESNNLTHLTNTRTRIHELATRDAAKLQTVMTTLNTVWSDVDRDLEAISENLQTGENMRKIPSAVKSALDEANVKYLVTARYLEEYARNLPVYKV